MNSFRGWPVVMGILMVLAMVSPFIGLWGSTRLEMERIAGLKGRSGSLPSLLSSLRARHRPVVAPHELELAGERLGLSNLSNLLVVRFDGEGFPYFRAWLAYDPERQQVVKTAIEQE